MNIGTSSSPTVNAWTQPLDRRIESRRIISLVLWVLTGFVLSFGVVLSIWAVRGILWLLGALGG